MITIENLKHPLATLAPAIGAGKTLPILASIRMQPLPGGELRLTANNMEMQISTLCAADHQDDGALCLDYQKLLAYSRISDQIAITPEGDKAKLKTKTRATINTLPAENFPEMITTGDVTAITVPAAELASAIDAVIYATATNDARFYLTGVLFRAENGQISITASDGHRLAQTTWDRETAEAISCIIPLKTAAALAKTFIAGDVDLQLGRNAIIAKNPATELIGKCIDAKYPNFDKVFNQSRPNIAKVDSKTLIAAIDAVSITANIDHYGVRVLFDHTLKLSARNQTGEESDLDLAIDYTGRAIELGFCARYLKEALAKIDGMAVIKIDDAASSLVIQGDSDSQLHVVMPMRI